MIWGLLDRIFSRRVIVDCERRPYLTRYYLFRRKALAVFLHRFYRSDFERSLHDHPWTFITVILWRGYTEHTPKGARRIWPGMVCYRPAEWRHRVELIEGKEAVTLVIRFRERRMWGFWTATGFLPWNKWWQANCE